MEVQSEVINMLLGILGVIASIAGILVSFYLYKSQIKYERDRLKIDIVNMCMQISIDITKINKRFTDITNEYYTLLIDKIKEVTTDIIDNIDDKKITSGHLEEIDLLISMMQNNNINNKEIIHTYLLTILNDY